VIPSKQKNEPKEAVNNTQPDKHVLVYEPLVTPELSIEAFESVSR
jgi:hypothetical protein